MILNSLIYYEMYVQIMSTWTNRYMSGTSVLMYGYKLNVWGTSDNLSTNGLLCAIFS